jgi:hypothetical protein
MMMAFPVIIAGAIFPQARTIYEFWRWGIWISKMTIPSWIGTVEIYH